MTQKLTINPYFELGNKSNRSICWIQDNVSSKTKTIPHNHGGFGIISASSHGNTASNWSASQQSPPPPHTLSKQKISVVLLSWNT